MEQVFNCVIPYIHNANDRNSVSLVSRKLYELDSLTRKHVTVHAHYAQNPSRVSHRFPFIESLTLKGAPHKDFAKVLDIDITPWIKEISVKFKFLKALRIRGMVVGDEDFELLARTRGKDLRSLRINKCELFSEDGLMYVSRYCNELRTLCLENNTVVGKANGEWLRELALRNMVIETFHFGYPFDRYDVKDVTHLAKNCCNSLVSLKIFPRLLISDLVDAFSHAIKLKYFEGAIFDENGDYSSFKFPPNICGLLIDDLPETSFPFLLPYVNQLRELHLPCIDLERNCQCFLFERCPNLEVLYTEDICRDTGLQVIGLFCKKLRKLTFGGRVTHIGLIVLAQGCYNLEYLHVRLTDISNEAMECIGTNLKNLRDFWMSLVKKDGCITDLPLDNGVRAMLMGCSKLKRLHVSLCHGGLTDMGLGYIGKYGHNLRSLFLGCTGESDAGLLELSKGCPKLRKLKLKGCPFSEQAIATFVFNIHSVRYFCVKSDYRILALTRPLVPAEVLTELKLYVTLAEKLHKLAVQLVADGSGVGSVKMTYTSSRATDDLDTQLVRAIVAKGIRINEERVILDGSSEKPLQTIKVQIANVESRFAIAVSESGEIKVEGRVRDGVPHLTKVGAFEVDVSLEGNIMLCRQLDEPNFIRSIVNILGEEIVNINSMSVGRTAERKQVVMAIGVDEKPSNEALNCCF